LTITREKKMKRIATIVFVLVLGFALTVSMASGADKKYSGFLEGYYQNLQPGPEGGVKERWLKPGTDFGKYNKIMLDSVVFFFGDDSQYKGIDPQDMKDLADGFNKAVVETAKSKTVFVSESGPDVVRIRFAITGLKQNKPGLSAVTSVIPVGLAISLVKKGAGGSWSGSGATSMEVMVVDSTTNDVVAVAVDDRSAGFTDRFSKWGSAEEAFKFWAERLKKFVEDVEAAKK
jgi:hypothetical protein